MAKLRGGLIQMGLKGSTDSDPETIRKAMIEAHLPLIEEAGKQGVQVLCFQEVFTQPYFCPSQDRKWYRAAERHSRRADHQADAGTGRQAQDGHRRADL